MTKTLRQVVIVGAGPYGLAAAAHLQTAGLDVCVFGEPMEYWRRQMPAGMLLRSSWEASHIADPARRLTLDAYQKARGETVPRPVPLETFVAYGEWFQRQVIPNLDRRLVTRIEYTQDGFRIVLADGDVVQAQRVVIAGGIAPFANWPAQFKGLPPDLVSHSSNHRDLSRFAGQQVVVVGGGQSAVEFAALLAERGADVELIARIPAIRWLQRSAWLHNQPALIRHILYPPTDVGPPGLNQIVARPDLFRRLPAELQRRIAYRSIRPAASGWLLPRVENVHFTTGRSVASATSVGKQVRLVLSDGTSRDVDHVVLATGYRVDIARYPFLTAELVASLRCIDGYPQLGAAFESSLPGLHFIGAPAASSFGPLMRFVAGTTYVGRELSRRMLAAKPTMRSTESAYGR